MSDWKQYDNDSDSRSTFGSGYGQGPQSGMKDKAKDSVDQLRHGAQEASGRAREGFDHYFHQHPLLIGAAVMALGVAVGMMLPTTRQEDRWMGEASHKMKERTREAAGRFREVAKTSFEEARDTARSELEERGLDPQSLKEDARGAAQQARDIAQKSAQEAKRTAQEEAERNR